MATETTAHGTESSGNSIVAAVLSLIIPGLGHYYAGKKSRGLYWFVAFVAYFLVSFVLLFVGIGILLFLVEPVLHLIAAVDAYVQS